MPNLGSDEITTTQEDKIPRSEILNERTSQFLKKWSTKLWRLLNTGLVLTVVGAITATFLIYHLDEGKLNSENNLAAKMLEIEIDYRGTRIKEYLDNVIRHEKEYESLEKNSVASKLTVAGEKLSVAISELVLQLAGEKLNTKFSTSLFNEYLNQNTATLLSRLTLVTEPDSRMRKILADAIVSAFNIQNISATIHSNEPKVESGGLIEGTKKLLEDLGAVTGKSYLTNGENSD